MRVVNHFPGSGVVPDFGDAHAASARARLSAEQRLECDCFALVGFSIKTARGVGVRDVFRDDIHAWLKEQSPFLDEQISGYERLQEQLAVLVDTLNKTIAAVTKTVTADAPQKSKLQELDAFKHEILELNRKSIFFDEFKFRRKVSDLYVAVATSIEPLSPSQEKGIGLLEEEFKKFKIRFYEMIK